MFYTYILRCTGNKLYIGSCEDLKKRFEAHKDGNGAHFTKQHTPQSIAYYEAFKTRADAMQREAQIKKWSNAKKEALIDGNSDQLRKFSVSHDHFKNQ